MSSKSSKRSNSPGSATTATGTPADLIRIGQIGAPHGLRGALKFRPDDPGSTLLDDLQRVFIEQAEAPVEYRLLETAPLNPRQMKIMVEGISDANTAGQLRGATVFAAKSDLPPTAENEFYYFQTVGCEVRTTDGRVVGHIKSTFFSGAHDIWVVASEGTEFMVPVIEDVVKSIDIEARRVTIDPIPGLLD
ncbi:MAG TPA: ribosome maturation factor RimM [Candidatus Binataceae bacterium]|nr:ribosome maturation factor RimM [Candidatus Binataceae bacterium]